MAQNEERGRLHAILAIAAQLPLAQQKILLNQMKEMLARHGDSPALPERPTPQPTPISRAVGMRLRAARTAKNMTQADLARALRCSAGHVSKIERGVKPIPLMKLQEACDLLEISMGYALTGSSPQTEGYIAAFERITSDCPPEIMEIILSICRQIARIGEVIRG